MLLKSLLKAFSIFLLLWLTFCDGSRPKVDPKTTEISQSISGVLPYFKGELLDPYWSLKTEKVADLKVLPEIKLLSHENQWVNFTQFKGKCKLIVFFFAKCHGVCPMITSNLVRFLPELEPSVDLDIISISIDPENDTVDRLIAYRKLYKITNPNWLFLTGDKIEIHSLARNVFSADVKQIEGKYDLQDFVHTENIFLLDKENYLRGIYRAKGTGDLERLKREWVILSSEI